MATTIVLILIIVAPVLFHLTARDITSADSLPVQLDLPGILIGAGFNHHQNTAIP